MKARLKKIFTNWRVILLMVSLVLAVVAIQPNPGADGVAIRNVIDNSSASDAGINNPKPTDPPMSRERIIAINSKPISNLEDYYEATENLAVNITISVQTNRGFYKLRTKEDYMILPLNETENKTVIETYIENVTINGTVVPTNMTRNKTIIVPKTIKKTLGTQDIGLRVYEAPKTNIRKGLDLAGGTRVLLSPEETLSQEKMDLLLDNMKQRLNVYGLSDIVVRSSGDLFSDNQYITVEIAGANEEEVKELLSTQGKFEAKIGNETVFSGGEGDIAYVCRSADCAGIDPYRGCNKVQDGYACTFRFSISLKPDAAEKQAEVTENLDTITTDEQGNFLPSDSQYLSKKLDLFLDDKKVDSLSIGSDLKGRAVTDIQISGSGVGRTEQEAGFNALENMKTLQTVLVTGSLPVTLDIVKSDNLSPQLGEEFIKNALLIGLLAILAVSIVSFIRYRKVEVFVPMAITMASEVILLLGLAALIGWNLDLAAIAGIIIAIGTGVDHQIVIADEVLRGEKSRYINWKQKFKSAFLIIIAAYLTTAFAMIPLYLAGAGMLKGFAITTLMGITFGVLITRPAYSVIVENLLKDKE